MFDLSSLGFVDELELMQGWNNVSLSEVKQYRNGLTEAGMTAAELPDLFATLESLIRFTEECGVTDLNSDPQVLSVIADSNGIAENAFGPAIKAVADEDDVKTGELVLSFGQDSLPVKVEVEAAPDKQGNPVKALKISIGDLSADIVFNEKENDSTGKKWVTVAAEFLIGSELVSIPILLEKDLDGVTKAHLKVAWKDGSITQYVKAAGGGSSYVKLRDLNVGEYSLVDVWENDIHPQFGRSWSLRLEGVPATVSSSGKRFEAALANLAPLYKRRLSEGKPQTLALSSKKELASGIAIVVAILDRAPNPAKLVAGAKPASGGELKSAAPAAIEAAAVVVADDADIPF